MIDFKRQFDAGGFNYKDRERDLIQRLIVPVVSVGQTTSYAFDWFFFLICWCDFFFSYQRLVSARVDDSNMNILLNQYIRFLRDPNPTKVKLGADALTIILKYTHLGLII
jgi:hypothetical protein